MKSLAALAAATSVAPAIGATLTPNKYDQVLSMYDTWVALKADLDAMNQVVNTLMNFMLDNFPAPKITEENITTVQKLMESGSVSTSISPGVVIDELYPLLVLKVSLRHDKLPMTVAKVERFAEFHARYGALIACKTMDEVRAFTTRWGLNPVV